MIKHLDSIINNKLTWSRYRGQPCIFTRYGNYGYTICLYGNDIFGEYVSVHVDDYLNRDLNNRKKINEGHPYFEALKETYQLSREMNVYA